jgi:hypothetical protein
MNFIFLDCLIHLFDPVNLYFLALNFNKLKHQISDLKVKKLTQKQEKEYLKMDKIY